MELGWGNTMKGSAVAWRFYQRLARELLRVPGLMRFLGWSGLGYWLDMRLRYLQMRALPNPIITHGLTLHWHRRAPGGVPELAAGVYERETHLLVERLLAPGMTMVDLGAHFGFFSLVGARSVGPSGKVYAFEPQPDVFRLLLENISANAFQGIIRPINKAVTDRNGFLPMHLGTLDSSQSSLFLTPGAGAKQIVVEVTSLDSFFAAEGWPEVHLIKIDVEGAEKLAFEGMTDLVRRSVYMKIILEFAPHVQTRIGIDPEELFRTLRKLGFHKYFLISERLVPIRIPDNLALLERLSGSTYVNLLSER
jgi:FkbM family methyltransferase